MQKRTHSLLSTRGALLVVPSLLTLLALLLVAFQYHTLEKLAIFPPSASLITLPDFLDALRQHVAFDRLDSLLLAAILLDCCALVYAEWAHGSLSSFFTRVFANQKATLLALLAFSLLACRFYFARGELSWGGDAPQHIVYASMAAQTFSHGEIPIWTFVLGNGSPYLQNYGFLFFYAAGLLDLLFGDIFLSLKLLLAACHVLSGIGMYYLTQRLCQSRQAAFIAALAYVLCFWHTQQVLIMGRLPLGLFYALLPWPFFACESLGSTHRPIRASTFGALSLCALFFTHPGYGTYAALFAALYGALRLWSWRSRSDFRRLCQYGVLLVASGLFLSTYITLGLWSERDLTNMHDLSLGIKWDDTVPEQIVPDPTWRHVLGWSNFRFWLLPPDLPFHWYGGYLGLSLTLLAAIGLSAPFVLRQHSALPIFVAAQVGLLAAVLLVFAYRLPPLQIIQLIQAMNAARYLLFVAFFLALMTGVGLRVLYYKFPQTPQRDRLFTLVLLFVLLDLGPTTFQHPYHSAEQNPTGVPPVAFAAIQQVARPYQEQGLYPNFRASWFYQHFNPYLATGQFIFLTGTPTPAVFHPSDLRTAGDFSGPFSRLAAALLSSLDSREQFSSMPHADVVADGQTMLNNRYALVTQNERKNGFILEQPAHTPILVSANLAPFLQDGLTDFIQHAKSDPTFRDLALDDDHNHSMLKTYWIVRGTAPNLHDNSCERIYIRGQEGISALGTQPTAEVLQHEVREQRVDLSVRVSADSFVRLAYAYSPFIKVTVDGREVESMQTAGRFIAFFLAAGQHEIVIEPQLSPLRRILLTFSAALLLVLLVATWRESTRVHS